MGWHAAYLAISTGYAAICGVVVSRHSYGFGRTMYGPGNGAIRAHLLRHSKNFLRLSTGVRGAKLIFAVPCI